VATAVVEEATGRRRSSNSVALLYLVLMIVIGSSTATAAKFAVRELPVWLLPVVRFGGAGLCLLPLVWGRGTLSRMVRGDGLRLVTAAALCVPINQAFFLSASRFAPTSHVALIYAACPLVVLGLAVAWGQERLALSRLLGILACVAGVMIIGLDSLWRSDARGTGAWRGDLLLIGAVGSWGGFLTVNKPLVARHGPLTALVGTFLLGALLELPIALATIPTWRPLGEVAPSGWWALAHLTLVASVCGLACQNQALRWFDASQVAAANNAAPLLTVLWGAWLLGESVTPAVVLGGVLTLSGVVWANRAGKAIIATARR
jgi:drug/metabolite transporter (DMT)-like permease